MKKLFLLLLPVACLSQIVTPNLQMTLPPHGATNYDTQVNGNFQILDQAVGILQLPFKGVWNSAITYSKGQQVTFSGNLYYSLVNFNLNNSPNVSPLFWVQVTGTAFGSRFCLSGNGFSCDTSISRDSTKGSGFFDFGTGAQDSRDGTLFGASYLTSTRADRQLILQNPDFEGNSAIPPAGWTNTPLAGAINGNSTLSYETSSPASGKSQSLKVSTSAQFGDVASTTVFSVIPGDVLTIEYMAKGDGNSNPQCDFRLGDKSNGNIGNLPQSSTNNTTSSSWVFQYGTTQVPSNGVQAFIRCTNLSATQPSVFWIDQVVVRKVNFANIALVNQLCWSSAFGSACDFGISRSSAGTGGAGNGTAGDFSATWRANIVNAGTGFQIGGAAPSSHVPRGNGTNYVDAQLACGDLSNASASCSTDATNAGNIVSGSLVLARITPGSNGQCLNTTGGVAAWGSCAGTAGVQLIGAPNVSNTTVNANTTGFQVMGAACASTPCYSAAALNSANKTFSAEWTGLITPGGGTSQTICFGINVFGALTYSQSNGNCFGNGSITGTWSYRYRITCTTTVTGASGTIFCTNELWAQPNASTPVAGGGIFNTFAGSATTLNLTTTNSPELEISFTTGSTSNSASTIYGITHQHN